MLTAIPEGYENLLQSENKDHELKSMAILTKIGIPFELLFKGLVKVSIIHCSFIHEIKRLWRKPELKYYSITFAFQISKG
jgi:hypothetical protein